MVRLVKVAICFCLIMMLSTTALASDKMIYGTGLMQTPTADVAGRGLANVRFLHMDSSPKIVVTAGITDNLEINVAFGQNKGDRIHSSVGLKGRVINETKDTPALSVGLQDNTMYVVASKRLDTRSGLRGHIGVGVGQNVGPFIGLEKPINPVSVSRNGQNTLNLPPTTAVLEVSNRGLSAGVQVSVTPEFTLEIALTRMSELVLGGNFKVSF